eukprot:scaffold12551_cov72-Cylindrotheca_fusiformis.AAC.1
MEWMNLGIPSITSPGSATCHAFLLAGDDPLFGTDAIAAGGAMDTFSTLRDAARCVATQRLASGQQLFATSTLRQLRKNLDSFIIILEATPR